MNNFKLLMMVLLGVFAFFAILLSRTTGFAHESARYCSAAGRFVARRSLH